MSSVDYDMEESKVKVNYEKSLDVEDFVEESQNIIRDYMCPLCYGVFAEPVVTCGHVFCKKCIAKWIEINSPRKDERDDGTLTITPLIVANEVLNKQMVKCKNAHSNCEWKGKLQDRTEHITIHCYKQPVQCPHSGCVLTPFRENLPAHLNTCEFRIVSCPDCQIELPFNQLLSHEVICPQFKLPCPQACGEMISRCIIPSHIQDCCLNTIVDCPYKEIGCSNKLPRKDLSSYLTRNTDRHNLMMIVHIKSFTSDLMTKVNTVETQVKNFHLPELIKKLELSVSNSILKRGDCFPVVQQGENDSKFINRKRGRSEETKM